MRRRSLCALDFKKRRKRRRDEITRRSTFRRGIRHIIQSRRRFVVVPLPADVELFEYVLNIPRFPVRHPLAALDPATAEEEIDTCEQFHRAPTRVDLLLTSRAPRDTAIYRETVRAPWSTEISLMVSETAGKKKRKKKSERERSERK